MGVGDQRHAPAALPPAKIRYPLYRMGGPQGRFRRMWKFSSPTGIRTQDRPARSESLFRLSYPGPHYTTCTKCSRDFLREDIIAFSKMSSRPLRPNPSPVLWVPVALSDQHCVWTFPSPMHVTFFVEIPLIYSC
jgi:hypothetical protein